VIRSLKLPNASQHDAIFLIDRLIQEVCLYAYNVHNIVDTYTHVYLVHCKSYITYERRAISRIPETGERV
jgi:hypothetical protein